MSFSYSARRLLFLKCKALFGMKFICYHKIPEPLLVDINVEKLFNSHILLKNTFKQTKFLYFFHGTFILGLRFGCNLFKPHTQLNGMYLFSITQFLCSYCTYTKRFVFMNANISYINADYMNIQSENRAIYVFLYPTICSILRHVMFLKECICINFWLL